MNPITHPPVHGAIGIIGRNPVFADPATRCIAKTFNPLAYIAAITAGMPVDMMIDHIIRMILCGLVEQRVDS